MRRADPADIDVWFDVERLQQVLEDHRVSLAILFGSHATGTADATSDVDIAVELGEWRPSDPDYNDRFFSVSADISEELGTDDVDVVDVHSASPPLATSIFENGVLLLGDPDHVSAVRRELTAQDADQPSARERIDAALARIDEHLEVSDGGVPATGPREADRR